MSLTCEEEGMNDSFNVVANRSLITKRSRPLFMFFFWPLTARAFSTSLVHVEKGGLLPKQESGGNRPVEI